MSVIVVLAQIIIALSIVVVWVFRFDNIVQEFKQYGLPDLVRNMVGATKIRWLRCWWQVSGFRSWCWYQP